MIRALKSRRNGFTIVELLIVIVVIAILAALSVVAFNGVQQRANNIKTTAALSSWVKAMKLYKTDNSRWPPGYACLGEGYGRGPTGSESAGFHCRQDSASTGAYESVSFNAIMKEYVGGSFPVPATTTAQASSIIWRRGLTYLYGGGSGNLVYIEAAFAGSLAVCPAVDGAVPTNKDGWNGNTYCFYQLGLVTDS